MATQPNPTKSGEQNAPRRNFLKTAWTLLGLVAVGELLWIILGFLKPGIKASRGEKGNMLIKAGHVDDFPVGSVTAFVRGRFYLSRLEDGGFLAISRKCTHLGCTIPWMDNEKKFICPCHASAFDIAGDVISPPAPRPLDIHPISIDNGIITVNAGQTIRRKTADTSLRVYA